RVGRRRTLKSIQPAFPVGIRFCEGHVTAEELAFAEKPSSSGGKDRGDRLQTFNRPDGVADNDLTVWCSRELEFHDVAQHSGGEFREANAPDAVGFLEEPVMRR